jgi:hypothetical protein
VNSKSDRWNFEKTSKGAGNMGNVKGVEWGGRGVEWGGRGNSWRGNSWRGNSWRGNSWR